jgi:hypothetical protein
MWSKPLDPGTAIACSRKRPNHYLRSPPSGVQFDVSARPNSIASELDYESSKQWANVVNVERPTDESPGPRQTPSDGESDAERI